MPLPFIPKTGETVVIEYEGRTVQAYVNLASPNGKSLIVSFDAMLGGHLGMMAVTVDDNEDYVSLIEALPVKMRRMS